MTTKNLPFLLCFLAGIAAAASLPEETEYRGEIRRGPDGRLMAVPVAPPVATTAPSPTPASGAAEGTARVLRVGPRQDLRTLSAASKVARDGDTIEVEPGDYIADVAIWKQNDLTIRGVGAVRPRLIADGASVEQKGIWIVRGGRITVENLEFRGARVADRNGAGIRFEQGQLTIRNCKFEDNENSILSGGNPAMRLDVENSEFGRNAPGQRGFNHNIYVGNIGRLRVSGSYFHSANKGHLIKSRALENHIFYNRLTDESGGQASYELEFPDGGVAYVVGNLIEQSADTDNATIISFGTESYKNGHSELYLVNNTIVDNRPDNGNILAVKPGLQRLLAMNNLLVSRRMLTPGVAGEIENNPNAPREEFVQAQQYDFRLRAASPLRAKYFTPPTVNGVNLIPQREYAHPAGTRPLSGGARAPGAFQTPG